MWKCPDNHGCWHPWAFCCRRPWEAYSFLTENLRSFRSAERGCGGKLEEGKEGNCSWDVMYEWIIIITAIVIMIAMHISYEEQIIRQHLSMTSALVSASRPLPRVSAAVSISGRLPLLSTFLKNLVPKKQNIDKWQAWHKEYYFYLIYSILWYYCSFGSNSFEETQRLLTCTFLLVYFFHNTHMPTHTYNVLWLYSPVFSYHISFLFFLKKSTFFNAVCVCVFIWPISLY